MLVPYFGDDWRDDEIDEKGLQNGGESGIIERGEKSFTPAATIGEANRFAMNELGIKKADYSGVDVRVANEWNMRLAENFRRFPEIRDSFNFVGEVHRRNELMQDRIIEWYKKLYDLSDSEIIKYTNYIMTAYTIKNSDCAVSINIERPLLSDYSGITLNHNFANDYDYLVERLKNDVETKFHPQYCDTIAYLADHEIAHRLDYLLDLRNMPTIQAIFDGTSDEQMTEDLSEYAWNNSNDNLYAEFIAEAWAEYNNSPSPRLIAKEVGGIIERWYKKWTIKNTRKS